MVLDDNALCTVDEVKAYLDVEELNASDFALIESLINQISKQMDNYCGGVFGSIEYTEYHDSNSNDMLFPNHYPITSVSGIWNDASWGWSSSTEIDNSTYRIANNNSVVLYNGTFGSADQNIKIIYTAGYSTTPKDVSLACIKEVARVYRLRIDKGTMYRSEDRPSGTISSSYVVEEFLPETVSVLNRYRIKSAL